MKPNGMSSIDNARFDWQVGCAKRGIFATLLSTQLDTATS